MLRRLAAAALLLCLAALAAGQDMIRYNDRVLKKNDQQLKGTIEEESPAGIKIKVVEGKNQVVKTIPASDIVAVTYKSSVSALDYRAPFSKLDRAAVSTGKARTKLLEEAVAGFTKLEGDLKGTPNARRYVQYKIAEATALLAQDDPGKRDDAIKLLTAFKTDNPTSWTIVPALKTLARLQEDAGKSDDARKTYEELAAVPDVPKDLQQESEILVGRLLLRGNRHADAQARLEKLVGKMSDNDAQKPYVLAYLAQAKIGQNKTDGVAKELEAVIKASTDAKVRGVAFNLLGDLHSKAGRLEDAFWAYLRVDAMYNDDAEEQAKALYHLSSLFDRVKKDPARGKDCARRLRDKRFAGTPYQKLLPPDPEEKKEDERPKKDKGKKDREKKD